MEAVNKGRERESGSFILKEAANLMLTCTRFSKGGKLHRCLVFETNCQNQFGMERVCLDSWRLNEIEGKRERKNSTICTPSPWDLSLSSSCLTTTVHYLQSLHIKRPTTVYQQVSFQGMELVMMIGWAERDPLFLRTSFNKINYSNDYYCVVFSRAPESSC